MTIKKIHFVWIGSELPEYALDNLERFTKMNPDYEILLHDEHTKLHPLLADKWRDDLDPASKSDLIRYSVLHREGGWYFDLDFFPLRPVADADGGWGHDHRCLISKQQGHMVGAAAPYANAPIRCEPGCQGLFQIIAEAANSTLTHRCRFGPPMVRAAVSKNQELFNVVNAGWFFPLAISDIKHAYPFLKTGDYHKVDLCSLGCGGQMPIAAHLWAGANDVGSFETQPAPIAVVQSQIKEKCLDTFSLGLEALGYTVVRSQRAMNFGKIVPDLLVCWNGIRDTSWSKYADAHHIPILFAEYGFFNRGSHYQVDHKGILQHASWANTFTRPDGAATRLSNYCEPVPVTAKTEGSILVLGQLAGDTQLLGSEIAGPAPLVRAVSKALASLDVPPAVFRPHPQDQRVSAGNWSNMTLDVSSAEEIATRRNDYAKSMQGNSLSQSLAKARFCIAINSNALVEATAAGVPCLAFGPSLGINAGVYRKATLVTLAQDIKAMLDGWTPEPYAVKAYLETLATRQYSLAELQDPTVVKTIIARAGVHHE